MANTSLIAGARSLGKSKGFLDIGDAWAEGASKSAYTNNAFSTNNTAKLEVENKNKQIASKANTIMSNMRSDIDFTGFDKDEIATMASFLIEGRRKYANAAKAISKMEDATSPEYMEQLNILQSVNNSFLNLKTQTDSFKKNKVAYAEDQYAGQISDGNIVGDNFAAANIFGLAGEGKPAMTIKEGGLIGYVSNGKDMLYNDMKLPFIKDYATANLIMTSNKSFYSAGKKMDPYSKALYRNKLSEALTSPESLRSIVYDFNQEIPMNGIHLNDDNSNINEVREMVINQLVNASDYASGVGMQEAAYRKGVTIPPEGETKIVKETDANGEEIYFAITNGKVVKATDAQIKAYLAEDKTTKPTIVYGPQRQAAASGNMDLSGNNTPTAKNKNE
jgi:hypothetical protein